MTIKSAYITKYLSLSATLGAVFLTVSCASNTALQRPSESVNAPLKNLVHGKVIAADTHLPVAGATVFVPKALPPANDGLAQSEKVQPLSDLSLNTTLEKSMGCKVPTQPYSSFACTDHLGNFTISLTNTSLDNMQLKFQYRDQSVNAELTLNDLDSDLGTILLTNNQDQQQKGKIAIVLDMSAKITPMQRSLGNSLPLPMEVEFQQQFVKLYDIDESQYDVEFMQFPSLFEDKDSDHNVDIFKYKIVYLITTGDEDLSDLGKEKKSTLLDFISNGGELYVTTLSVDTDEHSLDEYI